jgi:hypothetical protein
MENGVVINKSAIGIKSQILNRFDRQSNYSESDYKIKSKTIHFDDLNTDFKNQILSEINFNKFEIPVLISYISIENYLLVTTEKFYYRDQKLIEIVQLNEFDGFEPDEDEIDDYFEKTGGIWSKEEGHITTGYLYKKDGSFIKIKIFSGNSLFPFWNTINIIERVGRYKISDYLSDL